MGYAASSTRMGRRKEWQRSPSLPATPLPSLTRGIRCLESTTTRRSSSPRSRRSSMSRTGETWPSLKITRSSTLVLPSRENSRVWPMDLEARPMPKTHTRVWTSTCLMRSGAFTIATKWATSQPPTHTVMSPLSQCMSLSGQGSPCSEDGNPTGKWVTTSRPTGCSSTPATTFSSRTSSSNTRWRRSLLKTSGLR